MAGLLEDGSGLNSRRLYHHIALKPSVFGLFFLVGYWIVIIPCSVSIFFKKILKTIELYFINSLKHFSKFSFWESFL